MKGYVASVPESNLKNFVNDINVKGCALKSAKKLSAIKKLMYGFGKCSCDIIVVEVTPDIDFEDFGTIARKYQKVS